MWRLSGYPSPTLVLANRRLGILFFSLTAWLPPLVILATTAAVLIPLNPGGRTGWPAQLSFIVLISFLVFRLSRMDLLGSRVLWMVVGLQLLIVAIGAARHVSSGWFLPSTKVSLDIFVCPEPYPADGALGDLSRRAKRRSACRPSDYEMRAGTWYREAPIPSLIITSMCLRSAMLSILPSWALMAVVRMD